jgi:hypothetical protein
LAFIGLPDEQVETTFSQLVNGAASGTDNGSIRVGVCWNATNAFSGKTGGSLIGQAGDSPNFRVDTYANFIATAPTVGLNTATSCEAVPISAGASAQVFYGTNANMQLIVKWRG